MVPEEKRLVGFRRQVLLLALIPLVAVLVMISEQLVTSAVIADGADRVDAVTEVMGRLDALESAALSFLNCAGATQQRGGPAGCSRWSAAVEALGREFGIPTEGIAEAARELQTLAGAGQEDREALLARFVQRLGHTVGDLVDRVRAAEADGRAELTAARTRLGRMVIAQRFLGIALGLVVLAALIFPSLRVARRIRRTTEELMAGVERFRRGDYEPIRVTTGDELQSLAESFNALAESTVASQRGLERANAELSTRVRDLEEAQERMLASERLATMGLVSAGLAHEINNPLAYVQANATFVSEELKRIATRSEVQAEVHAAMADLLEGCDRLRAIVQDLQSLSRVEVEGAGEERVDVRRVLDACVNVSRPRIRERAVIAREYAEVPPVRASSARLGQVFLNLIVNAAQSIPLQEGRGTTRCGRARPAIGWSPRSPTPAAG